MPDSYEIPLYPRLVPKHPWTTSRISDTDLLELEEASEMATKHACTTITVKDILRAAGRGEISLCAIVGRMAKLKKFDGGIYCNGGTPLENKIPEGSIPILPVSACVQLANVGRASWRTFDGYKTLDGQLVRYSIASLTDDEPDLLTSTSECRISGYNIHALADQYIPTGKLYESADACDYAEIVRNGRPIEWRYWAGQPQITPEQGAKLVHCIDPIEWKGEAFALGTVPTDLRIKIAKLENLLKQQTKPLDLQGLVRILGSPYAPYNMEMAANFCHSLGRTEIANELMASDENRIAQPIEPREIDSNSPEEHRSKDDGSKVHRLKTRSHELDHIMDLVTAPSIGSERPSAEAAWAIYVSIAKKDNRPAPLLGYPCSTGTGGALLCP
ncbi:hypothetical protein [Pseudoduganella danionis]|uniref:hypothetical protein n=1 Tax=Pseudoduganella danionis TaxID=1890295 RepID=UPI0035B348BB